MLKSMIKCDMSGKIVKDNVKRITFSHMRYTQSSIGYFIMPTHGMPENIFDVCEDCGMKVLEMITKNENQEDLHADR